MTILAKMKKLDNGSFEGKLKTATLDCSLRLQPVKEEDKGNNYPDYRAKIGGYEAGGGWKKTSENDNAYISVQLDDPTFPTPINANLIQKDDNYILLWTRKD